MSRKEKIDDGMTIVKVWLDFVEDSIRERGGNPDDAEWFESDCVTCGGPLTIIVYEGDSFNCSTGNECCIASTKRFREEIGLKVASEVSISIDHRSHGSKEGTNAFMERMRKSRGDMS
jgi:hypothetical protein